MTEANLSLTKPDVKYEAEYMASLEAYVQAGDKDAVVELERIQKEGFGHFVHMLQEAEQGRGISATFVPATSFWLLLDGKEIVGRSHLRHHLNDRLITFGGHIGYEVHPDHRRKGYGTRLLALSLIEAREIGLERVLLTCDPKNTGSVKIITKNGGVLQDTGWHEVMKRDTSRYWIDL